MNLTPDSAGERSPDLLDSIVGGGVESELFSWVAALSELKTAMYVTMALKERDFTCRVMPRQPLGKLQVVGMSQLLHCPLHLRTMGADQQCWPLLESPLPHCSGHTLLSEFVTEAVQQHDLGLLQLPFPGPQETWLTARCP